MRNAVMEAGGIWNLEPMWRSMVVAWETEKVVICAWMVQNSMVVAQMGSIRTIILTSSTSVRVDSCHLLTLLRSSPISGALMAALSKNLHVTMHEKVSC